jgi:putative acetyltransferase
MTSSDLVLRPERPGDGGAIAAVVRAAFQRPAEADLVAALRAADALAVSLVALAQGEVVGYVALSPVTVDDAAGGRRWLGLAPLAVRPDRQGHGAGRRLAVQALAVAARQGAAVVFVLGDPAYYRRLGFGPAGEFGWRCVYDVPAAAFQARWLAAEGLPPAGIVRYHAAFAGL